MPMKFITLLAPLALLLCTACGPTVVYEQRYPVAESGWAYADSLRYEFALPDTTQAYDFVLTVEHDEFFPYQNFYVLLHTGLPSGARSSQQVSLQLAGEFGAWRGDCSGERCTREIEILRNARFTSPGQYSLTVEQHSRDEPLTGIGAVGFRVQETE